MIDADGEQRDHHPRPAPARACGRARRRCAGKATRRRAPSPGRRSRSTPAECAPRTRAPASGAPRRDTAARLDPAQYQSLGGGPFASETQLAQPACPTLDAATACIECSRRGRRRLAAPRTARHASITGIRRASPRGWSTRCRWGTTVYRGSLADSRPARKMAKRSVSEPASTSAAAARAPPRRRPWRSMVSAPVAVRVLAAVASAAGAPALVGLGEEAEPALHDPSGREPKRGTGDCQPAGGARGAGWRHEGAGCAGACRRAAGKDERQLAPGFVPDGNGRVGQQRRGVGGKERAEHARRRLGGQLGAREPPDDLEARRQSRWRGR